MFALIPHIFSPTFSCVASKAASSAQLLICFARRRNEIAQISHVLYLEIMPQLKHQLRFLSALLSYIGWWGYKLICSSRKEFGYRNQKSLDNSQGISNLENLSYGNNHNIQTNTHISLKDKTQENANSFLPKKKKIIAISI